MSTKGSYYNGRTVLLICKQMSYFSSVLWEEFEMYITVEKHQEESRG